MTNSITVNIYDDRRMVFIDADFMDTINVTQEGGVYRIRVDVDDMTGSTSYILTGTPAWITTQKRGDELWLYIDSNKKIYERTAELTFSHIMTDDNAVTIRIIQDMDVYDVIVEGDEVFFDAAKQPDDETSYSKRIVKVAGGRREPILFMTKQDKVANNVWTSGKYDRSFEIHSVEHIGETMADYVYRTNEVGEDGNIVTATISDVMYSVYEVTVKWNGCTDIKTDGNTPSDHRYVLNAVHADKPCEATGSTTFGYEDETPGTPTMAPRVKVVDWTNRTFGAEYAEEMADRYEQKEMHMAENGPMFAPSVENPGLEPQGAVQQEPAKEKTFKLIRLKKNGEEGYEIDERFVFDEDFYIGCSPSDTAEVRCYSSVNEVSVTVTKTNNTFNNEGVTYAVYKISPTKEIEWHGNIEDRYARIRIHNSEYPTLTFDAIWKYKYIHTEEPQPDTEEKHSLTAIHRHANVYYVTDVSSEGAFIRVAEADITQREVAARTNITVKDNVQQNLIPAQDYSFMLTILQNGDGSDEGFVVNKTEYNGTDEEVVEGFHRRGDIITIIPKYLFTDDEQPSIDELLP